MGEVGVGWLGGWVVGWVGGKTCLVLFSVDEDDDLGLDPLHEVFVLPVVDVRGEGDAFDAVLFLGRWVGGMRYCCVHRKEEEERTIKMRCCGVLGRGWVGRYGWVGGWVGRTCT